MEKDIVRKLRLGVEEKFGKTITRQKDIEFLQGEIFSETELKIGYNTLRRFFGLLPSSIPNRNTLTVLSKYIGFESLEQFTKYVQKDNRWKNWMLINRLSFKEFFTEKDIERLTAMTDLEDYPLFISSIIKTQFSLKRYNNLKTIFSKNELFDINYPNIVRIAATVGLQLRNIPLREIEDNMEELVKTFNFRYVVLHHFQDYSHFNGYYGILAKWASKHTAEDHDKFFFDLILGYKAFLSGQPLISKKLNQKKSFHPILRGRYHGFMVLTANKEEKTFWHEEIITEARKLDFRAGFFLEIIPELIIGKDIKFLQGVYKIFYEDLFDRTQWDQYNYQNIFLMGLALTEVFADNLTRAETTLSFVEMEYSLDSYTLYLELLHCIVSYQLHKKKNSKAVTLKNIEQRFEEIIHATSFHYFSKDYLTSYL